MAKKEINVALTDKCKVYLIVYHKSKILVFLNGSTRSLQLWCGQFLALTFLNEKKRIKTSNRTIVELTTFRYIRCIDCINRILSVILYRIFKRSLNLDNSYITLHMRLLKRAYRFFGDCAVLLSFGYKIPTSFLYLIGI